MMIKMSTFFLNFVKEAYLKNLTMLNLKTYQLYNAIGKFDILNIQKHLMLKNKIKCFDLFRWM